MTRLLLKVVFFNVLEVSDLQNVFHFNHMQALTVLSLSAETSTARALTQKTINFRRIFDVRDFTTKRCQVISAMFFLFIFRRKLYVKYGLVMLSTKPTS